MSFLWGHRFGLRPINQSHEQHNKKKKKKHQKNAFLGGLWDKRVTVVALPLFLAFKIDIYVSISKNRYSFLDTATFVHYTIKCFQGPNLVTASSYDEIFNWSISIFLIDLSVKRRLINQDGEWPSFYQWNQKEMKRSYTSSVCSHGNGWGQRGHPSCRLSLNFGFLSSTQSTISSMIDCFLQWSISDCNVFIFPTKFDQFVANFETNWRRLKKHGFSNCSVVWFYGDLIVISIKNNLIEMKQKNNGGIKMNYDIADMFTNGSHETNGKSDENWRF